MFIKNIVFFENNPQTFFPITLTRLGSSLLCGCLTNAERIINNFSKSEKINVSYIIRDELVNLYNDKIKIFDISKTDTSVLFINSALVKCDFLKSTDFKEDSIYLSNNNISAIYVSEKSLEKIKKTGFNDFITYSLNNFEKININDEPIKYLWELVDLNPKIITNDFNEYYAEKIKINNEITVYGDKTKVYIGDNAKIHPYVVFDTTSGPVIIENNSEIHPFTRIEGPAFIGEKSIILGAKIRSGTSIGKNCRIGGEIENSIFIANSNKYHDGFIGHSYIGEWVNLGALTTNSDLKNNYSEVSVLLNGEIIKTGRKKVGSFIGDHTKTSIGVLFNTGTYIGIMCNIVASNGLSQRFIPSFSNYLNSQIILNENFDKLIETAKIVKSRREEILTDSEKDLYEKHYERVFNNPRF